MQHSPAPRKLNISSTHFLIKNKIAGGDIKIQHKPTGSIWCDILTKPKQGAVFRELFRVFNEHIREYNDKAERLLMQPDLLSKDNTNNTLSETNKVNLEKSFPVTLKVKQMSFAHNVSLEQKGMAKKSITRSKMMSQQLTKQASPTVVHCRSVVDNQ